MTKIDQIKRDQVAKQPTRPLSATVPTEQIIAAIYRCIDEPAAWQGVLSLLLARSQADAVLLCGLTQDGDPALRAGEGLSEAQCDSLVRLARKATDMRNESALGLPVLRAGLELADLQSVVLGGGCLLLARAAGRPAFEAPVLDTLDRLRPHLRKAAQLGGRLQEMRRQQQSVFDLLGGLGYAALYLDAQGRICQQNQRAKVLLGDDRCLTLDNRRLLARGEHNAAQLQRCLRPVLGGAQARSTAKFCDEQGCLDLLCMSLAGVSDPSGAAGEGRAVVFISERDAAANLSVEALAQAYSLSPSEAELMLLLANDYELGEVAAARGTSINTVRSQLAALRAKTGTSRQTGLVRLALMSPARLASAVC